MKEYKQHGRFVFFPNMTVEEAQKWERDLSYIRKSSRFMPNPEWGKIRLFSAKHLRCPIGLLHRITQMPKIARPILSFSPWIRDYQRDAIYSISENVMGIIQIPTGGGKTTVAVEAIRLLFQNKKVLVLVPTIDLVIQWKEKTTATVQTYQSIKDRAFLQTFDVIFFDECHHAAAKTIYRIGMNCRQDTQIYGLSATPFLRDEDNLMVEAVLGPIVYRIGEQELISGGFIVNPTITFLRTKDLGKKYFFVYKDAYDELIMKNEARNIRICSLIENDRKHLILVTRVEHGELLHQMLKHKGSVFLHGGLSKEERTKTDAPILIATGIYDEGVDIPEIDVLIIAGGGKSDIKTIQRVGRALRPSKNKTGVKIFDFYDRGKWIESHAKSRVKLLSNVFGSSTIFFRDLE